jgi:hypothetical protein
LKNATHVMADVAMRSTVHGVAVLRSRALTRLPRLGQPSATIPLDLLLVRAHFNRHRAHAPVAA